MRRDPVALHHRIRKTEVTAGEAVFSSEAGPNQEVNTALPPTLDEPATYYLVFRNNARSIEKKVVQADFRIDF